MLHGQEPNFISHNSRTGFPSSTVYQTIEDQDGFLWFCGPMGVTRFDGQKFRNFTTDDGLPDNEILEEYVDSQNRIWFSAFSGEVGYYHQGVFHNSSNDSLLRLVRSPSFAYSFLEDKKHRIWIGTRDDGLVLIDGDEVIRFPRLDPGKSSLVGYLAEYGDSILALGTNLKVPPGYPMKFVETPRLITTYLKRLPTGEIAYLDEEFHIIPPSEFGTTDWASLPFSHDYNDLHLDENGHLWVVTVDGVKLLPDKMNGGDGEPLWFLKGKLPTKIVQDFQGGVWVTTFENGVCHIPNWKVKTFHKGITEGFPDLQEQKAFAWHEGSIYFADGRGAAYRLRGDSVEEIIGRPSVRHISPRILMVRDGWLWEGTQVGLFGYKLSKDAIEPVLPKVIRVPGLEMPVRIQRTPGLIQMGFPPIKCGLVLQNGHMAFGTSFGLIEVDLAAKGPGSENEILKLRGPGWLSTAYQDNHGDVWYGTRTGVYRFDGTKAEKQAWLNEKIPSQLNHITGNGEGLKVFCTNGYGIFLVDGQEVIPITAEEGLASNICNHAIVDGEGALWVATHMGINRIRFKGGDFSQFSIDLISLYDGLAERDVKSIRIEDGNLIACTGGGFSILPLSVVERQPTPPRINLAEVRIQGEKQPPRTRYELPWSNQDVEVSFTGIAYKDPEYMSFLYRWKERDTTWIPTQLSGLQLNGLPSGLNTLEIKSKTAENLESEQTIVLQFMVRAPYWKTWWFLLLCLFGLALLVYFVIRIRTYQLRKARAELSREVNARTRELERANSEIMKQKEKAESADHAKSEFLATMSHEIRTPLNGVIGLTDLLLQSKLDESQYKLADNIKLSGKVLLSLINDILDFSKIEAGKLEIEAAPVDLRDCIDQVVRIQKLSAEEKGLVLQVDIAKNVPKVICGDAVRLQQILINLLGNAIKFTDKGQVTLRVMCREGEEGQRLEFAVEDTGIGIPEDKIKELFQRFQQVDTSTTRKYGGSGLGLAICAHLCGLMGGEIQVESELGKGSKFTFNILAATIPEEELKILDKSFSESRIMPPQELSILVADDNAVNLLVASGMLERLGLSSHTVENGFKVLEALEKEQFQLILMDLQMPGLDGIETTRRIRASYGESPLVVAMTANVYPEQKAECLAAGMNDFISKPFTLEELRRTIVRHFGGRPAQEIVGNDMEKNKGESPEKSFDLASLQEISGGEASFMVIVLEKTVESLKTVGPAMTAAVDEKDYAQVFALAHKLKSTTLNVGAKDLSQLLSRLEQEAHVGEREERIASLGAECGQGVAQLVPLLEEELKAWMA